MGPKSNEIHDDIKIVAPYLQVMNIKSERRLLKNRTNRSSVQLMQGSLDQKDQIPNQDLVESDRNDNPVPAGSLTKEYLLARPNKHQYAHARKSKAQLTK